VLIFKILAPSYKENYSLSKKIAHDTKLAS